MAQADGVVANGTGAAVRADLNDQLAAVFTNHSGSSEPATTYAYQWWADTTANVLKIRNSANNGWITLRELDGTMLIEDGSASTPGLSFASDTNSGLFGGSDTIGFATGGAERLEIGSSEVVFNDPSNDVDFRVESNGNTHMLFVDAGNDQVGIGISTPSKPLHIYQASDAGIRIQNSTTGTGTTDGLLLEATGSDGLLWNYESGNLRFATANSERARIDSSGRLLVATTSSAANSDADDLQIGAPANSTQRGITIASSNSGSIRFADDGNDTAGYIFYSHSDNSLRFGSNGAEKARIDSSGRLLVGTTTEGKENDGDNLTLADSGNCGLTIRSGSTSEGGIYFSHGTSGTEEYKGYILYDQNIDAMRFGTDAADRMRITSAGLVAMGTLDPTVTPSQGFCFDTRSDSLIRIGHANGTASGSVYVLFGYNSSVIGSITQSGTTAVAYNTTSDYRLKENVVDIADGITRVKQLQPKRFNFIADADTTVDGFLAHEAQTVVPEAVTGAHNEVDGDNNPVYQGIDQSKLVPLLTAALQEAIAKIETLETKVAALEAG